jgi:WD40 repeat protein
MRRPFARLFVAQLALASLAVYNTARPAPPVVRLKAPPRVRELPLRQGGAASHAVALKWKLRFTLRGHTGAVYSAAFFPDGTKLVTSGDDGSILVWNVLTGRRIRKLDVTTHTISDVAVSPGGGLIAGCTDDEGDSTVRIWDARTLRLLRTLRAHKGGVFEAVFSPDGKLLASGGRDQMVRLWDARTGKLVRTLAGHTAAVTALSFSPDGGVLASAGAEQDDTIRLWDVQTGGALRTLEGHQDWVTTVAFSPDGATLASGSRDKKLILWDARTGEKRWTMPQSEMVYELDFSRDGKLLAEGGGGRDLRLHDAHTGSLLGTLQGHTNEVNEVKFSLRGSLLASGSYDGTVKIWAQSPTSAVTVGKDSQGKWFQ